MNCDFCDNPAVVHEVTVKNGIKKEIHLCQQHASQQGIDMPEAQPITQLLTHVSVSSGGRRRRERKLCEGCGMSFAEFRKTGNLGCPDCYEAFDALLAPLIERAQNGATHHAGKSPCRAGSSIDRQLHIQRLLKELNSAVSAEQYERAADIRDQISSLETVQPSEGA